MNERILQKFLDESNLKLQVEIVSSGINRRREAQFVCVVVVVYNKNLNYISYPRKTDYHDDIEYEQYHCYELKGKKVVYESGNSTKGMGEGILNFFGDEKLLSNYFESLCRQIAVDFFRKNENQIRKINYIITESQFKFLTEIERTSGHYYAQPVYEILDFFNGALSDKEKVQAFRNFFEGKLGFQQSKKERYSKPEIISFYENIGSETWPKLLIQKSSLSGFAYYLAKNYFELQKGLDLDYLVTKDYGDKEFYFFDPLLKIFVGKISVSKIKLEGSKFYKVTVSVADEELIGTGYGTKMYLTLINIFDYLASDRTLFSGAYRMWKHVLPKYVNVWGVYEDVIGYNFDKLVPNPKKSVRKYDFFIASMKDKLK